MGCVGCKTLCIKSGERFYISYNNGKMSWLHWPKFKSFCLEVEIRDCIKEHISQNFNNSYKIYIAFNEDFPEEIMLAVLSEDAEIFVLSKNELMIKDIIE